jgi:hypothetical protein
MIEEIKMELKSQAQVKVLGVIVLVTGLLSVAADVLSVWSLDPRGMDTALSVDFAGVKYAFLNKPRWSYVLGNYFGTFILPIFHLLGMYLVAIALKPLARYSSLIFLFVGAYLAAVGSGMHGTLAFVGDIVQSGDQLLIDRMLDYWQPWAYALVVFYFLLSLILAAVVVSKRTQYPRWMFFLSPLGVMVLTTLAVAILPPSLTGVRSFLTVTGLNLPMLIFYIATVGVLLRRKEGRISIPSSVMPNQLLTS